MRFKRLFSADDILNKCRAEMNKLLADAQRQIFNIVNLAEETKKQLRAMIAEAERKISVAEKRLAALQSEKDFSQETLLFQNEIALQAETQKSKKKSPSKIAAEKYKKNSFSHVTSLPSENAAYALAGPFKDASQKNLFSGLQETQITVTSDGNSYGRIPLVKPEIVASSDPIIPKKNFNLRVKQLYEFGKTVEEIATETGHSTTEVDLVLAMMGE